jgi:hypothetical protein
MQLYFKSQSSKGAQRTPETKRFIWADVKLAGCVVIILCVVLQSSAAPSNSLPPVDEVAPVKSVFVDNAQFGKDPFFPKSGRRVVTIEPSTTNTVIDSSGPVTSLTLKGISGVTGKRLAIINNRTFEVGEEGILKVLNQTYKVRCVEIRDKSILINVNGQTQELFLGPRF